MIVLVEVYKNVGAFFSKYCNLHTQEIYFIKIHYHLLHVLYTQRLQHRNYKHAHNNMMISDSVYLC